MGCFFPSTVLAYKENLLVFKDISKTARYIIQQTNILSIIILLYLRSVYFADFPVEIDEVAVFIFPYGAENGGAVDVIGIGFVVFALCFPRGVFYGSVG